MDPITLETFGVHDFNGQLPSLTFTAHPKLDPQTGELVCFGYEAMGDGTPDICYYSIDPDGTFNQTVWLVSPVVGMIHDFAVTENWVRHHMHISAILVTLLADRYDRYCFQLFLKFAISIDSSKVENIGNGIRMFRFIWVSCHDEGQKDLMLRYVDISAPSDIVNMLLQGYLLSIS